MADLSDVSAWFETECASVCYPNGTGSDPITGAGKKITLGRGWPDPKTLDSVMAAGNAFVSIYPMPGMERNTTRYPKVWKDKAITAATLVLTVSGLTVTVSGTPSVGQAAMVTVGATPYGYACLAGDTVDTVATALAALIPGASAAGTVITLTTAAAIGVTVSTQGTATRETRRQQRVWGVHVWAPTPQIRDTIAQTLDSAFADIERFDLPDGYSARLIYHGTTESDELQVRSIYKRVLMYSVEYPTTETETTQTVGATSIGITVSPGV